MGQWQRPVHRELGGWFLIFFTNKSHVVYGFQQVVPQLAIGAGAAVIKKTKLSGRHSSRLDGKSASPVLTISCANKRRRIACF